MGYMELSICLFRKIGFVMDQDAWEQELPNRVQCNVPCRISTKSVKWLMGLMGKFFEVLCMDLLCINMEIRNAWQVSLEVSHI
jgi:hypothetical protein